MTDVSVVIPCIHEFPQLYQTVFSIQNEFVDENFTYEIVIAENGEEDPLTSKFMEDAEKFFHVFRDLGSQGKIRRVFEPRQCGPIARNTGAKTAEGKYLVFTDGHVCWGKNTFPLLVETLEKEDAGIVHGSTVWSHYDEHHAGCYYALAGNPSRPQLLTHGHGFYQRCKGKTEPFKIAGGTGAYILFWREEFLRLRGYHEDCRFYPHPEGYIDLKYWMFQRPVYVHPKAFHYHSLYPRNYGKGPQDYCGHDHHVENVMICMYTLGGEKWLKKVVEACRARGDKIGVLEMLAETARGKAAEEHSWILDHAPRSLDETLQWLADEGVAGMENAEMLGLKTPNVVDFPVPQTISFVFYYRNRPLQLFKNCLKSLLNQTRKVDEILVSDVGSCEPYGSDMRKLCDEHGARYIYSKLPLTESATDLHGYTKGYNIGVRQAKGDLIVTSGMDFIFESNMVECILDYYRWGVKTFKKDVFLSAKCHKLNFVPSLEQLDDFDGLMSQAEWRGGYGILCARREWWHKVHGMDESLRWYEDLDLAKRAAMDGLQILWLGDPAVNRNIGKNCRMIHQPHIQSTPQAFNMRDPEVVDLVKRAKHLIAPKTEVSIVRNGDDWGIVEGLK